MKAFRVISSIIFALLLLVSSTSFSVGIHLCNDEIRSVALFSKADGCEKQQSLPPCHRHSGAACCDDETVVNQADDFKASVAHADAPFPVPIQLGPMLVLIAEVIPAAPHSHFQGRHYHSPLRSHDLTVEHRVFLI